jgi:hypothetical protein
MRVAQLSASFRISDKALSASTWAFCSPMITTALFENNQLVRELWPTRRLDLNSVKKITNIE